MVAEAKARGLELTGPNGLLKLFTKNVLETATRSSTSPDPDKPPRPGPAASPDRDVSRGVGGHLARLNGSSIRGRAARCRRWWGSGPAIADRGSVRGAGAGPRARRRRRRDRTRRCAHSNARD